MAALARARIRVVSIRAQPGRVHLLVSSRVAARAERILGDKPSLPTPERSEPISILCFVGECIGRETAVRERIEQAATTAGLELSFDEDEIREHAIRATVPANQTELALQSLCTALDLLAH
jgi:aspartokinase